MNAHPTDAQISLKRRPRFLNGISSYTSYSHDDEINVLKSSGLLHEQKSSILGQLKACNGIPDDSTSETDDEEEAYRRMKFVLIMIPIMIVK